MEKPLKLAMTTVTKLGLAADRDKQEAGPEKAKKGRSGEMRGGVPECLATQGQAAGCPAFQIASFMSGSVPSNNCCAGRPV